MSDLTPAQIRSATSVVRDFLELLEAEDLDAALGLLDDDVVYTNVSLPTVRGRASVARLFGVLLGPIGFRVFFHAVGTDESDSGVVITERTDALVFGPVTVQFWVYGRFEVRNGHITLWRDSFDWRDYAVGTMRGVVGAVLPFVRRAWPGDAAR